MGVEELRVIEESRPGEDSTRAFFGRVTRFEPSSGLTAVGVTEVEVWFATDSFPATSALAQARPSTLSS